jgi:membrane associated rhomboid family serine protease
MSRNPLSEITSRLGPGLKGVLIAIAATGLLQALLVNWLGIEDVLLALVCIPEKVIHGQIWRLLTAGFLTDISHPGELIFTLIGLVFLSPDLERRWGTRRFLVFLALSVIVGNLLAIGVGLVAPDGLHLLHRSALYGANAALVGTAIAWGVCNRDQTVNFFMIFPMTGRTFVWLTVVGCSLYLLFQGEVAGFGGVITGFTLVGEPSALRRAYLRLRLAVLRGQGGRTPTAADILRSKGPILRRSGDRPPLRVVKGGHSDEAGARQKGGSDDPPKDKRYLN